MSIKWGLLGVLLIASALFSASSLSQDDCMCELGYVCVDGTCLPASVSGNTCDITGDLRTVILEEFGIAVTDDCSLDTEQLRAINHILSSVPRSLHNVSEITTISTKTGPGILQVSPEIKVGEGQVDKIPDEKEQHTDAFSTDFVYGLNREVMRKKITGTPLEVRQDELIIHAYAPACETQDAKNYLRSDYPCPYFGENREEFFPRLSESYFQDSYMALNLTLERFGKGYHEPLNQFLFFADIYSLGSNMTKFYRLDRDGFMEESHAFVRRDARGHINFLGSGEFRYYFSLDQYGNVMSVSKELPEPTLPEVCNDGTIYGECSLDKPLYCEEGELADKCSVCGCEKGYYCENERCVEKCDEGTPYLECSYTLPFYCDNGTLVENCFICGCYPYSFCDENGSCQYDQTSANHPPAITPIEDMEVREGEQIGFLVNAYDVDQDTISYHVFGLPEGSEFNRTSTRFEWTPRYDQAGYYEIIFAVSDGTFNDSEKIVINVINVNRRPKPEIAYPSSGQEFYVNEIIRFSGKGSTDPDMEELALTWDFGDGDVWKGIFVNHTYDNPGTYNVSLEADDGDLSGKAFIVLKIKRTEEPIPDRDRDGVEDPQDRCPDTPPLKKVNIYGCPLPEYEKFRNNLTTDFSRIDLVNATNVTIGIPERGMIEFRKNVMNLADKNIDGYVEMGYMDVDIDTEKIPELNRSAVITFYNVTIEDPLILRDGFYCHDCRIVRYSGRTFAFSVPHFTKYSLMAWASYSGYCGDGLCSIYETCHDCTDDCGACGEIEPPSACEEYWVCGPWSECNELDLKTRDCKDVSFCGTGRKKPSETTECKDEPFPSLTLFGVMVFILTTIYIVLDRYKKRSELRKLSRYELHEIIKGYMYRGFTKPDIRKVLRSKGYSDKEINELMEEVEKEMF